MTPPFEQLNSRILLIDDNPAIHEDIRKILALRSVRALALDRTEAALRDETPLTAIGGAFEVDSAHQGEEGVQKAQAALAAGRPYAVAFVDVRMPPGWDGIETVDRLWQACPDLQIVICTAHSDYSWQQITSRLTQLDSLLILKKPFDNIEVLQMANALTRKWSLTQQVKLTRENLESLVEARTRNLEVAHEQLRQAQKMEAVGQLAAGVAHDFNNILTVIQGHAGLHLEANLDAKVADSFREVSSAASRAANLTRQLLAFSRKQIIRPQALNLTSAISSVGGLLHRLIGEHVSLQIDCDPDLPPILADACSVEQIVINLAVNARDAMPQGGSLMIRAQAVTITEAGRRLNPEAVCGQFACLSVTDTGCGMDESIRNRIFEPFFTTKDVGKGTGMGLATVHGIVKQHQGWIEVESQLGKGTTFKAFLPLAPGAAVPERAAAIQRDSIRLGGTVLVVEDQPEVRSLVSNVLTRSGCRVFEAASAAEALTMWREHGAGVDLLFTDMVMPGEIKGGDLAAQLLSERPQLKVIYTSGYSLDLSDSNIKLERGVNYLPKPFKRGALLSTVACALGEGVLTKNAN